MKNLLKKIVPAALAMLITSGAYSQQVKRKNIDSLSPGELAAYEHALQVLNDRSIANPYDQEGYAWQAWVHNNNVVSIPTTPAPAKTATQSPTDYYKFIVKQTYPGGKNGYPGECEHGKDLFLFWHRAEFYYFEKILQNADPAGTVTDSKGNKGPSTSNVSIPYWDFTSPASGAGKRFPKAFENTASVLYHAGRNSGEPNYSFTSKEKIQEIVSTNWPIFGGFPDGVGGGARLKGFGRFESEIHNPMHATYCGGDMDDNSKAAYDPIFYSFHAYLDFVFDEWLRIHHMEAKGSNEKETITSLDYHLRGELPWKYNLPAFDPGKGSRATMSTCSLYLNHAKLGYEYAVTPQEHYHAPLMPINKMLENGQPVVFGKNELSAQSALTANTFLAAAGKEGKINTEPLTKADIQKGFLNFETTVTSSYRVDVYIYPKEVKAAISDAAFRNKYLANSAVYWKMSGAAHDMAKSKTGLNIYIARALDDIRINFKPGEWVITTNLIQY